jgi:hypothetical protein
MFSTIIATLTDLVYKLWPRSRRVQQYTRYGHIYVRTGFQDGTSSVVQGPGILAARGRQPDAEEDGGQEQRGRHHARRDRQGRRRPLGRSTAAVVLPLVHGSVTADDPSSLA